MSTLKELLIKLRNGEEVALTEENGEPVDSILLKEGQWTRKTKLNGSIDLKDLSKISNALGESPISREYAMTLLKGYITQAERSQEATSAELAWLDAAIARLD